jgi:diguanylate cyclase (GGDEF)-like protein/PAS domain S-box-containing protein
MSSPVTSFAQGLSMDQPKQHASRADILTFPHMSRKDERLLQTILNNMSQGVLMFDSETRLIFSNQRYIELYGLSAEIVKPGCHLRDLLKHRAELGSFSGDVDEYVARLRNGIAEGKTFNQVVNLPDGRAFSVVNKPIAGGGWLATHEDVTERQRSEDRIAHMARHDALTDLPNRMLLLEQLNHEIKRVKRGECLAVLCLDLDQFKSVNDALGHHIGDELLKLVSERLRGCTRELDVVARMGGDEFAIIMTQMEQAADAATLSKRIRDSVIKPYQIEGHQIVTDISIGISVAPMDAVESDELLRNADMALYDAKADGRGTFRFFEPEMNTRMRVRRELEMDLRKALATEQFELHYQPLVVMKTNDVNAFEALLRWNHPTRGMISPADFIPIAEETGLIVPLGEWVLKTACNEAVDWPDHIKVAVNLSPAQLNSRNLVSMVTAALNESGMSPQKLQLEITETVLLQNTFTTLATLHELRKMGVQIALDDFGTGYSSLSYLRSFPFDKIKIDRSFIQDLSNGAEPLAIVNAVAGLAKCLNMTSTAEGVETQQQMEVLQSIGCTEMQGYLFSHARPAKEIRQFFAQRSADKAGVA